MSECSVSLMSYPIRRPDRFNRTPCRWQHGMHMCVVDFDVEDDNIKARVIVITFGGRQFEPALDPYDSGAELVEAWIDRGYPDPVGDYFTRADFGLPEK